MLRNMTLFQRKLLTLEGMRSLHTDMNPGGRIAGYCWRSSSSFMFAGRSHGSKL